MVFGLPMAVTVGWTLGTPAPRPATVGLPGTGTSGGAGGMGSAPEVTRTAEPPLTVDYAARPARPAPTSATAPALPAAPGVSSDPLPGATPSAPALGASSSPPPSLTLPPVPTPTEITVTPSPSSSPSAADTPSEAPLPES